MHRRHHLGWAAFHLSRVSALSKGSQRLRGKLRPASNFAGLVHPAHAAARACAGGGLLCLVLDLGHQGFGG